MVDIRGKDEILYIEYNQEKSHFAVGTQTGFYIYNIDNGRNSYQGTPAPSRFKQWNECGFVLDLGGGIGIIEMNYKTNLIALVGGGKNPKYPPNKVMIWDDHAKKCTAEFTFLTDVKGVKIRREK